MAAWRESAVVPRSIILCRKVRPAGTTLAAKLKVPMRDKSTCLVLCVRPNHSSCDEWMSWSLSWGSLASREAESKRMLRYSRQVVGPSSFSSARGTPRDPQRVVRVWRCRAHWAEPGVPARK